MNAFSLALIFGKNDDVTHNFNYPLFVVAFVTFIGCILWLAIDPIKQIEIKTEDKS